MFSIENDFFTLLAASFSRLKNLPASQHNNLKQKNLPTFPQKMLHLI